MPFDFLLSMVLMGRGEVRGYYPSKATALFVAL